MRRAQKPAGGLLAVAMFLLVVVATQNVRAAPPYDGTIFIDPDIITAADPTAFSGLTYAGQGVRTMFDRRVNAFVQLNAYLFNATYSDGLQIEFEVNPEFGSVAAAQAQATYYAPVIGRLPRVLRLHVLTSWIHQGDQPFGGGNNNLLIHTGSIAQSYIASGILEEALAHEASHTSLDAYHAAAPGWLAAQTADPNFISTYARDNPTREDIAESFVPYLAVRLPGSRVGAAMAQTILSTIPNRIAYFDAQHFDLSPASGTSTAATVVEFYNASLDHYFITWIADEIIKLDAGTKIKGWTRTGKTFRTYTTAQSDTSPVCRFYIPPGLGDSHFFGRGTAECNSTGTKNPSFVLEDPAFMQMYLPVLGVCPVNTTQVYRVFSNRPDANHRYMTDKTARDQMVTKGWLAEGDGPDLVVMCVPQ